MNERIVFTNPNGSVSVLEPTGNLPKEYNMEVAGEDGTVTTSIVDITAVLESLNATVDILIPIDTPEQEYRLNTTGVKDIVANTRIELVEEVMKRLHGGVLIYTGDVLVGGFKVNEIVFTLDEMLDKTITKDIPVDSINIRKITVDELPQDRLFRAAWDDSNLEDFIGVNLPKAKEIAHGLRRSARDVAFEPNLEVLRKDSMGIPLATGENVQTAKDANSNYKAAIDDVAQIAIDVATTEDELRLAMV